MNASRFTTGKRAKGRVADEDPFLPYHCRISGQITADLLIPWSNQSAVKRMTYQRKSKYI